MLIFEDEQLEKSVINKESCIAVPFEVFQNTDGEITVLTYSFCRDIAEKYIENFNGDIFENKAIEWVNDKFGKIMLEMGYEHYSHEGEMMLEYSLSGRSGLNLCENKYVRMISENSELERLCENTGCSIEINDDGEDILFAAIENNKIISYAGINDVSYADGSVEISVETAPERRREGYGISCVSALTNFLLEKNKTVRYKCSLFNKPSSALAEKCGFSLEGKRYSYVCGLIEDN